MRRQIVAPRKWMRAQLNAARLPVEPVNDFNRANGVRGKQFDVRQRPDDIVRRDGCVQIHGNPSILAANSNQSRHFL
jgi:hypothetical protein